MPRTVPERPASVPDRNQVIVVMRFVSMPLVMASVVLSDIARMDLPSRVVFSIVCTPSMTTTEIAMTISWYLVRSSGPIWIAR